MLTSAKGPTETTGAAAHYSNWAAQSLTAGPARRTQRLRYRSKESGDRKRTAKSLRHTCSAVGSAKMRTQAGETPGLQKAATNDVETPSTSFEHGLAKGRRDLDSLGRYISEARNQA